MNVINDLLEKAKDLTEAAGKKTDEFVQISRLKMSCVSLNSEIKAKYENLGNTIYNMIKSGEEDTSILLGTVSEIDILFKKISDNVSKIEELKKIVTCPKCATRNKTDALFCAKCGSRIIVTDDCYELSDYYDVEDIE